MIELKKFARFIKETCTGDVSRKQWQLLQQFKQSSQPLNAEQLYSAELLLQALLHFLIAIEETVDFAVSASKQPAIRNNLTKAGINTAKLLYTQKQALIEALPLYTLDVQTAIKVISELNGYYLELEAEAYLQAPEEEPATERLNESEERYKDLFDSAHDLIHIVEPGGIVLYVNNAWMRCLGYKLEEIKGKSIYHFVCPDGREKFAAYRDAVLRNNADDKEITVPFQKKSGEKIILEGFVSPKLKNGNPVYTRGIFRDITAKIKSEEERRFYIAQLAEREQNLKQLVTHAPDAIIVVDVTGKISLWNPKAEEIFGWVSNEAVGKTLEETIIPPAFHQAHQAGMQRYLSTGIARIINQTIEVSAMNKKGDEFLISLTISRTQRGGETVFISFIRDISQQKKNEIELVRKRKELEHSNRELEQYAWLTSHDLKEPLRKISTFSDLILTRYSNDIPDDVVTFLQKIQEAGKRMGNLIGAILLYSGVTEEQSLFEAVDLQTVLHEVLSDLEVGIKDAGAQIKADAMPVIEGVPFQLKQLLQNIIGNAIKYRSTERNLQIVISASVKNVNSIELRIQDNGAGFSMDNEKKIFGLFQRLNADKSIKGTGVGLALCKKIVLNHRGEITVQSELEKGATFFITLPIKQTRN
jgi:two-component system sensor kinase FixL